MEETTVNNDWRSSLPAEYQEKYTEFQTPADVMKGYEGLVTKLGKNPLVKPADDAPEDVKQKFNADLRKMYGVPENQDAYMYELSNSLPAEISDLLTEERLAPYKQAALDSGVTPEGFKAMLDVYQQELAGQVGAVDAQSLEKHENAVASLKKEWGDNYDDKVARANKLFKDHVPEADRQEIVEKYGNDPVLVKTFAALAEKSGEVYQNVQAEKEESLTYDELRNRARELTVKSIDGKLSIEERKRHSDEATKLNRQALALQKGSR